MNVVKMGINTLSYYELPVHSQITTKPTSAKQEEELVFTQNEAR